MSKSEIAPHGGITGRKFYILHCDLQEDHRGTTCQKLVQRVTEDLVADGQHFLAPDSNREVMFDADCVLCFIWHSQHWYSPFTTDVQLMRRAKPKAPFIPIFCYMTADEMELVLDAESPLGMLTLMEPVIINEEEEEEEWMSKIKNAVRHVI